MTDTVNSTTVIAHEAEDLVHGARTVRPSDGSTRAVETLVGYRTTDRPGLDRLQNVISGVCATVAGAALVAITVITIVEVATRLVADHPLGWNVGLVEEYLMTAMAFFGMVTAYRSGAHIAVASVYQRFSGPVRKAIMIFAEALVAFALVWLIVAGVDSAVFSFQTSEQPIPGMSELPLPSGLWKSIMPTGALLGLVVVLVDLYRELTSRWDEPSTDYAPDEVGAEADAALAHVHVDSAAEEVRR